MRYKVHRIKVNKDNIEEMLEMFLNNLSGEIMAVFPSVSPTFRPMGATARVDSVLVVEKVG